MKKIGDEVILNLNDKKLEGKAEIDSLSLELSKIVEEFIFYNLDAIDAFNHLMDCELNLDFVKVLSSELEKKVSEKLLKLGLDNDKVWYERWYDDSDRYIPCSRLVLRDLLFTIFVPVLILYETLALFSLNLTEIKYKPKIFPVEERLKERGENTLDILAQIQMKERKLPESIEYFAENYFNSKLYFKGIAPGRMNLYLYDLNRKKEYSKEHLPEGLLKGLVILTALEQNPSILLIDEIENSLHPELLEFILTTLKEDCDGCVFVTTHSPIVLNLVEPEEIFIFKPTDDGVEIKNLTEYKSKEEIIKELEELGITLGEKVLYGLT